MTLRLEGDASIAPPFCGAALMRLNCHRPITSLRTFGSAGTRAGIDPSRASSVHFWAFARNLNNGCRKDELYSSLAFLPADGMIVRRIGSNKMISLFTWPTPNGQKIQIMLEECGFECEAIPVNMVRDEQFAEECLSFKPCGQKVVGVFEAGVILLYTAEKAGRLIPEDAPDRTSVLEWLFYQGSSLGPMLGHATHFRRHADRGVACAVDPYTGEAARQYDVLERRWPAEEWLAGDTCSIADILTSPWFVRHRRQEQSLQESPVLARRATRISERPAVTRGKAVLKDLARGAPLGSAAREILFGQVAE